MPVLHDNQLHLNLPQLDQIGFKSPSKKGIWSSDNGDEILNKISEAISISDADHKHDINSIPDIWARPLLFASNLISKSSPGHKRILNEWRGLLSLIALQKVSQYHISYEILNIHDLGDFSELKTALENLQPNGVQWDKIYEWDTVILIKLDEFVIGALSPSTLVYTGTSIKKIIRDYPRIHKDNDGVLCPPQNASDRQQLESLFYWIDQVKTRISSIARGQKTSEMVNLLDDWLDEICALLGGSPAELKRQTDAKYILSDKNKYDTDLAKAIKDYPVYSIILDNVERQKTDTISDLDLRPTLPCDKTVYVITESLLADKNIFWGQLEPEKPMKPKEIMDKYFNKPWGDTYGDTTLDNAIWIRPDLYFFTDRLTGAEKGDLISKSCEPVDSKYLLPLHSNLFRFFKAQDLKDIMSPKFETDGSTVNFSIKLPVGQDKCLIERSYDLDLPQSYIKLQAPVMELFPHYMGPDWKRYYLIYTDTEKIKVKPLRTEQNPEEIKYYELDRELRIDEKTQKVHICHFYTEQDSNLSPYPDVFCISDDTNQEIGMVLNLESMTSFTPKKQCVVGIDFGTTNTNIYVEVDDVKSRLQVNIPDYFKSITESDDSISKRIMEYGFIPREPINMPIPSTIRIFDRGKTEHVLADYFIYKVSDVSANIPLDNIYSDIKWTEIDKQKQFFNSLLFMVFLEVYKQRDNEIVQNIEFRFSFPKVFNNDEKSSFFTNWSNAIREMFVYLLGTQAHLGLINTVHENHSLRQEKIIFDKSKGFQNFTLFRLSEGESAGLYAKVNGTNLGSGPIILDIGGGTTDISIWRDYSVLFDCSVKLAGKQLTELFRARPKIREILFSGFACDTLDTYKKDIAKFNVFLNYFLTKEEDDILKKLPLHATDTDIQWLKKLIMLGISALIYYCAQAYYYARKIDGISTDNVPIFWGGNAARFIKWIDNGQFRPDGLANKIFLWILANTLYTLDVENKQDPPYKLSNTNTKLTPEFKSEASGGMVIPGETDLTSFYNANLQELVSKNTDDDMFGSITSENGKVQTDVKMIHGDVIVLRKEVPGVEGITLKSYEYISDKVLFTDRGSNVQDVTLEKLKQFVAVFNKAGVNCGFLNPADQLELNSRDEQEIKSYVVNELLSQAYLAPGNRSLEPVFIMEIKKYLELLINR